MPFPYLESSVVVKPWVFDLQLQTASVEYVARPDLSYARWFDPVLADAIVRTVRPTGGVPRADLSVPISPTDPPTSDTVYVDPRDDSIKFALASYRLATDGTSGLLRYQVALHPTAAGAHLAVRIEPELPASAGTAGPLVHSISCVNFDYTPPDSGVRKSLAFTVVASGSGFNATVELVGLPALDEVQRALTSSDAAAILTIRRALQVAVPAREQTSRVDLDELSQRLRRVQLPKPLPGKFDPMPGKFHPMPGKFDPMRGGPILPGRRFPLGLVPQAEIVDAPRPLFRQVTRTLDCSIPLLFDPTLHAYIFAEVAPPSSGNGNSLALRTVASQPGSVYFQDTARPAIFYYVPDRYELARRPDLPYAPILSVTAANDDQVTVNFVACARVDPRRIARAAEDLATFVGSGAGCDMRPLPFTDWEYRLTVPGRGSEVRPRQGTTVETGFADSLTLTRRDFQPIWDALVGTGGFVLFSGTITANLPSGPISIPFVPSLADAGGAVLMSAAAAPQADGTVSAVLTNEIESVITIESAGSIGLSRAGTVVESTVSGLALPVLVTPKGTVTVTLAPSAPLPIEGAVVAILDTSGFKIRPDPEAILAIVLDERVLEPSTELQIVVGFPSNAQPPIEHVYIEFPDTDVVRIAPSASEARVRVNRPFRDVLLGREPSREVPYSYLVKRTDGSLDPKTSATASGSLVALSLPAVPPT